MKAKKKQLLIFLIVLVVLGGAVALLFLLPKAETAGEESSAIVAANTVSIWSYDTEAVSSIRVENETGSFLVEPDGEGSFVIAALAAYPRYHTQYTYLVSAVANLSAEQVVEEQPDSIEKYGLAAPQATVELSLTDGTVKTILLGDLATDGYSFYGKTGDSDTVYLLDGSTGGYLRQGQFAYISRSLTAGGETIANEDGSTETITPTLTYLQISRPDLPEPITIRPRDEEEVTAGLTVSGYELISPVVIDVGYTQKTTYLDETIGMAASAIAGIAATPEEQAAYGLDQPSLYLVVELDGKRVRLTFGNPTETGGYYMMTDATDLVYEMDETMVPWMTVKVEELMAATILNPMITTVDKVTVTVDGTDYAIDVIGDADTAAADLKIQYNGQQIVTDTFQTYYMELISLQAVELNTETATGTPEVTIRYHYRDGLKEDDVVSLIPQTDRRYIIRVNGRDDFIAYATSVQKIKADLQILLSGGDLDRIY